MKKPIYVLATIFLVFLCCCVSNPPPKTDMETVREALTSKDPSACDKIQDSVIEGTCFLNLAVSSDDASLCDRIKDTSELRLKDKCYMKVGAYKKDPAICGKIQDSAIKESCMQQL